MKYFSGLMSIVFFVILILPASIFSSSQDVEKIRRAIKEKGASWEAGETSMSLLSREEQRMRLGLLKHPPEAKKLQKIPPAPFLPAQFSWRDNGGDFVTSVKDQGSCGACAYFSTLASVESWLRIRENNPNLDVDLSEQYILSCSSVGSCENGAYIESIHRFVRQTGTVQEACFPYRANNGTPCAEACPVDQREVVKIGDYVSLNYSQMSVEDIKNAVYYGPVAVGLAIYEDFYNYVDGVYEHVTGDKDGYHAVLLYGWDDSEQSWLCKNSWGDGWGINGHFRIKWGEVEFGQPTVLIWDKANGSPRLQYSPSTLNVQLAPGESLTRYLSIRNGGTGTLEFVTSIEAEKTSTTYFHQSGINNLTDLCWWVGSEKLGGYDDDWLQYLDTPVLDLSGAKTPVLTLSALWELEDLDCDVTGYDGWDGWNVQVSTDGGRSFEIIPPVSTVYNCASLHSFGEYWNQGYGVPGFSGLSSGWQQLRFDLRGFRSSSTVIRFAFASNGKNSSRNLPDRTGLMIDDVEILDSGQTLFRDSAALNSPMQPSGKGGLDAKWIEIPYATGSLSGGEELQLPINLRADNSASGWHTAIIQIKNNHRQNAPEKIIVRLNVSRPALDVGVGEPAVPTFEWPALVNFTPAVPVKNWGRQNAPNVKTGLKLYNDEGVQRAFQQVVVESVPAGRVSLPTFTSMSVAEPGDYRLVCSAESETADDNPDNNIGETWFRVIELIDDFEETKSFWDYGSSWGITEKFTGGYNSPKAVHVNRGDRYENNMSSALLLKNGLNLSQVESASLYFWARFSLEKDRDFVHVQAQSGEGQWQTLASLTANSLRWSEYQVDLTPFCGYGNDHVLIRFLFVSDEQNTGIGFFMDDVSIKPNQSTGADEPSAGPVDFMLSQNFPNPFNPETRIEYHLPEDANVRVEVLNLRGQVVAVALDQRMPAGKQIIHFDGSGLASGVYLYRMTAQTGSGRLFQSTKKMLLIK